MAKIQGPLYEKLKEKMRQVIDFHGGPTKVRDKAKGLNHSDMRMLWDIWAVVTRNMCYDDNHPMFKQGAWDRIFPCEPTKPNEPSFSIYADESINDNHIETVLKSIGRELGLIQ